MSNADRAELATTLMDVFGSSDPRELDAIHGDGQQDPNAVIVELTNINPGWALNAAGYAKGLRDQGASPDSAYLQGMSDMVNLIHRSSGKTELPDLEPQPRQTLFSKLHTVFAGVARSVRPRRFVNGV